MVATALKITMGYENAFKQPGRLPSHDAYVTKIAYLKDSGASIRRIFSRVLIPEFTSNTSEINYFPNFYLFEENLTIYFIHGMKS